MYLAEMASLKMKFSFGNHRIILEFQGYNETLIHLVHKFFEALQSFNPESHRIMFEDKLIKAKKDY